MLINGLDNSGQATSATALVDAASGALLWEAEKLNASTPAAIDGLLAVVAAQDVVALDLESGRELWRTSRSFCSCSFQFPAIVDDTVVVVANDSLVYGLEAATGDLTWTVSIGENYGFASPGPAGLVALALGGTVVWLDALTGEVVAGAPTPIDGQVISVESTPLGQVVASSDGYVRLYAIHDRSLDSDEIDPALVTGTWNDPLPQPLDLTCNRRVDSSGGSLASDELAPRTLEDALRAIILDADLPPLGYLRVATIAPPDAAFVWQQDSETDISIILTFRNFAAPNEPPSWQASRSLWCV